MCDREDAAKPPGDGISGKKFAPLGNLRASGLPPHQWAAAVLANNWRKLRTRRSCCGNLAQPGC